MSVSSRPPHHTVPQGSSAISSPRLAMPQGDPRWVPPAWIFTPLGVPPLDPLIRVLLLVLLAVITAVYSECRRLRLRATRVSLTPCAVLWAGFFGGRRGSSFRFPHVANSAAVSGRERLGAASRHPPQCWSSNTSVRTPASPDVTSEYSSYGVLFPQRHSLPAPPLSPAPELRLNVKAWWTPETRPADPRSLAAPQPSREMQIWVTGGGWR